MRIVVCVKQVPDTASRLEVRRDAVTPVSDGAPGVMNPFDEFALEAALGLRDAVGGEVILLTLASESVEETIFHGLAMGADAANTITIPHHRIPDAFATAELLASAIALLDPDLIMCGERAVDTEAGLVPAIIAERLQVSLVTGVETIRAREQCGSFEVGSRTDEGVALREVTSPSVLSFIRGDREPRYPTLDDIFDAGGKPVTELPATDKNPEVIMQRVSLAAQGDERAGEIICGSIDESVALLLGRIATVTDVLA